MEKRIYTVGERVEKLCSTCNEELGHIVASITKGGQISRVICAQCGIKSTFKKGIETIGQREPVKAGAPYDRTRTYRTGQALMHPTFGPGQVTAIVDNQMIDVLFNDRLRRLIHARA